MKKELSWRTQKNNSVKAMIEHLQDNGMTDVSAETFLHINLPALGEFKSLLDVMNAQEWDKAWNVVDMYLRGDFDAS